MLLFNFPVPKKYDQGTTFSWTLTPNDSFDGPKDLGGGETKLKWAQKQ